VKARLRALVRRLPGAIAQPLLAAVGLVDWYLRPEHRLHALDHMSLLLRGTAREGEVQTLGRRYLMGRRAVEHVIWRPDLSVGAQVEGAEVLDALRAAGQGAIVMHVHLCWIAPQVYALAAQGHVDVIVLTLEDPPTPLQDLYERMFDEWRSEMLGARGSFKEIVDRLQAGRLCHIAMDVPGSTSCRFLEKPALLASGVAALALATGVPIVPVFPGHLRGRLTVHVGQPLHTGDFTDATALTQQLADLASHEILRAPERYHDHEWLASMWPSPA
jgi:lauroyl/myristoyl acyltransferase